mgnify:CR=1 FL=1
MDPDSQENPDIRDIINNISTLINQPLPRIRIIPNILFTNLIINDATDIMNRSFEETKDIVKPMCKEFKEGLKKIIIDEEDDLSCAICQDKFKTGENVIELPCKGGCHFFHFEEEECPGIYPWMEVNNSCPVCRCEFPMEPEPEPEPEPESEPETELDDDSNIRGNNINDLAENIMENTFTNIMNNYFERAFEDLEDRELDEAIRRSLEDQ